MQPNMKKQYRDELRTIGKRIREIDRAIRGLRVACNREMEKLHRAMTKNTRGLISESNRLQKRSDILKGRLS